MIADEIAKLFPGLYGQPSVSAVPDQSAALSGEKLKIGVVLSGGQAPGGHNVISGLFGNVFNVYVTSYVLLIHIVQSQFCNIFFSFFWGAFRLLAGACERKHLLRVQGWSSWYHEMQIC